MPKFPQARAGQKPDFLIISPPKTGSTWLTENLKRSPDIFIPPVKEIKYFSNYEAWVDLNWYLNHFQDGVGRVRGEASPSYALLPCRTIRRIFTLFPKIKLIYLMREPISRAWSHAKHSYKYGEANFAQCADPLDSVPAETWRENFAHDWTLASGDYLGQLRRWLSVFPKDQIFVGFFEWIKTAPVQLLQALARFLEINPDMEFASMPLARVVNQGLPKEIPTGLGSDLQLLLGQRTRQLLSFVKRQFNLSPPREWQETWAGLVAANGEPGPSRSSPTATAIAEPPNAAETESARHVRCSPEMALFLPAAFCKEFDDHYLAGILAMDTLAEARLIQASFRGYSLLQHGRRFYAVPEKLLPRDLTQINATWLQTRSRHGECLVADSPMAVCNLLTGLAA